MSHTSLDDSHELYKTLEPLLILDEELSMKSRHSEIKREFCGFEVLLKTAVCVCTWYVILICLLLSC